MELSLRGRGVDITDQLRKTTQHKLAKLARLDPRALRVEVEVISERNPRLDGAKRVEAAVHSARHTVRASAQARDAPAALDQVVERLERQIRDRRAKRRPRLGGNRLASGRARQR